MSGDLGGDGVGLAIVGLMFSFLIIAFWPENPWKVKR